MSDRIETFKNMLVADPENAMVLFGLANEYLKTENYREAARTLEEYLEKADDEGAAYGMLARAYEKLGESEKAKNALEQGIKASEKHGHPTMAADYRFALDMNYSD